MAALTHAYIRPAVDRAAIWKNFRIIIGFAVISPDNPRLGTIDCPCGLFKEELMKTRIVSFALACVCMASFSGCMSTLARDEVTRVDHFRPMIGTRSSLCVMGQAASVVVLQLDEHGGRVTGSDTVGYLLTLPLVAADLPATAAVDVIALPLDLKHEVDRVWPKKSECATAVDESPGSESVSTPQAPDRCRVDPRISPMGTDE